MLIQQFLIILLILAPVPKDIPPPEIKPGTFKTKWNESHWTYTLNVDGSLVGTITGQENPLTVYVGIWSWDAKKRELMLTESCNGWQTWTYYLFKVDGKNAGKCIESAYNGDVHETPYAVTWTFPMDQK